MSQRDIQDPDRRGGENMYGFKPKPAQQVRQYARNLRKTMTPAERLLWRKIRRKIIDFRFRKQHPVGTFILDFYCPEVQIAVEVDGGYHLSKEQQRKDAQRTYYLNKEGIVVLRFWNSQVKYEIETVIHAIWIACDRRRRGK